MSKNLISIQDAADLSKKSIQTIRRAIKAKKLQFKRSKTPQGFNYLIDRDSLCELFGLRIAEEFVKQPPTQNTSKENHSTKMGNAKVVIEAEDFKAFTQTLKTLVAQHSEERQNFLRLVNTLQEKIFVLENQLNLLKAPEKKWFHFWK